MLKLLNKFIFSGSRFRRNVASILGVQLVTLVLSTASAAIVARWLGPEGKGALAVALLVPSMLALILNGGIGVANVYYTASRGFTVRALTANSVLFTVLGTITGVAIVGFMFFTNLLEQVVPDVQLKLLTLAMLSLPLGLINGYTQAILQGMQQITLVNIISFT